MTVNSFSGYTLPPPCNGLNVNFCKNPKCANFGIPETPNRPRRIKNAIPVPGTYIRIGKYKGKWDSRMQCSICKEKQPIRSNTAIIEDLDRISSHLELGPEPSCPNSTCSMHGIPLSDGKANYASFGKTAAGTPRWRCNVCRKTFVSGGKSTRKHKMPHKNRDVLVMLMNKAPLNRISEMTGLDNKSIYGKIAFIHHQTMLFAQNREKVLFEDFSLPHMYVAVDRQTHLVNWTSRLDRRNIQLNAIGTADLKSGYVFGMHLNYDASMDQAELDQLAEQAGDFNTEEASRKYARFWLKPDYDAAAAKSLSKVKVSIEYAMQIARGVNGVTANILSEYEDAKGRNDIEDSAEINDNFMLPIKGVLIRQQYTMLAHFQMMAKMLANSPKVNFYLDQDSGIRAAFMGAFHERVKTQTADAFYVSILKGATIDKKNSLATEYKARFRVAKANHPGLTDQEVKVEMVKVAMKKAVARGYPDDFWLEHPMPHSGEPEKQVCWLTNPGTYSEDKAASLYLEGSLHAIDRFFMLVRRRVSAAERAYPSASQSGRKWYGYNCYQPGYLATQLDIFRVYYNYCLVGQDKKTPAMRLGLARGPIDAADIIYFEPTLTDRVPNPNRTKAKAHPAKKKETSGDAFLRTLNENKPWEQF